MEKKLEELKENLSQYRRVLIAFSGGLDSSFLTFIASKLPLERVVAITIESPLFGEKDLQWAIEMADELHVEHHIIKIDHLSSKVLTNDPRRCYYCKKEIFGYLLLRAREWRIDGVLHGANRDDSSDYRPGEEAARELGIKAPLQEVGLTKKEIRSLGEKMGLSNWSMPSTVCLASRIKYGLPLTEERLETVREAEEFLQKYRLRDVRVRIHDPYTLRIEVEPENMTKIIEHREEIRSFLSQSEYKYFTLDLSGYGQGSMNRVLEVAADE